MHFLCVRAEKSFFMLMRVNYITLTFEIFYCDEGWWGVEHVRRKINHSIVQMCLFIEKGVFLLSGVSLLYLSFHAYLCFCKNKYIAYC